MKVILTMTIKNGGSTVQMNSAEAYTKDVRVLIIIVGASGLIYSSISCQKKKKKKTNWRRRYNAIMYFSVDMTEHFKTQILSNIAARTS